MMSLTLSTMPVTDTRAVMMPSPSSSTNIPLVDDALYSNTPILVCSLVVRNEVSLAVLAGRSLPLGRVYRVQQRRHQSLVHLSGLSQSESLLRGLHAGHGVVSENPVLFGVPETKLV